MCLVGLSFCVDREVVCFCVELTRLACVRGWSGLETSLFGGVYGEVVSVCCGI